MLYPKIATCLNPECDFKLWPTVAKKKLTKTNLRDLLSKGKTSKVVKGFTGKKEIRCSFSIKRRYDNRFFFSMDRKQWNKSS